MAPVSLSSTVVCKLRGTSVLMGVKFPSSTLPICGRVAGTGSSLCAMFSASRVRRVRDLCGVSRLLFRGRRQRTAFRHVYLIASVVVVVTLLLFGLRVCEDEGQLRRSRGRVHGLTVVTRRTGRVGDHFLTGVDCGVHVPLGGMINFSRLLSASGRLSRRRQGRCSYVVRTGSNRLVRLMGSMLSLSHLRTGVVGFRLRSYGMGR